MPRTNAVESPGCPPLRALTTDVLGIIKVVEARGKAGPAKVVETWGPPDASRGILAASFADDENRPLIGVARKNNMVEIVNPLNGHPLAATKVSESGSVGCSLEDDPVVGLHLLKTKTELSSRLNVLLLCTGKGKASLRSLHMADASAASTTIDCQSTWDICTAGKVTCSAVSANEKYALFGGKGIEVNVWDLDSCSKTWTAKHPPSNSLGIFSPTWFTAAAFLSRENHHKIAAGTNNHEVRLYDLSAQRRPVISVNFRESAIKAVTADLDGHTVYIGTGSGDLASFDMRTGKLLGCFIGKCCGSIRSIARHSELPILASCGLDSYLRIWDTKTRQLLSAVFLKQHLTNVVIDSHFSYEECTGNSSDEPNDVQAVEQTEACHSDNDDDDDNESMLLKGSKKSKKRVKNRSESNTKQTNDELPEDDPIMEADLSLSEDETDKLPSWKRRKQYSEGNGRSKKIKKIKSKIASKT